MSRNQPLSLEYVQRAIQNELIDQKCTELHGGHCFVRALKFLGTGMERFTRLYFLYLFVIFVAMRRKKILQNPKQQLKQFLKGFVKSLLFGGVYLGIGVYVMCLTSRTFGNNGQLINAFAGTFGGVSLLIENPQRQPEIALFIFTQALKALYNMGKRRNMLLNIPEGFSLLYAFSMAIICFHYFNNKESLRKSYLSLIDKFLGNS